MELFVSESVIQVAQVGVVCVSLQVCPGTYRRGTGAGGPCIVEFFISESVIQVAQVCVVCVSPYVCPGTDRRGAGAGCPGVVELVISEGVTQRPGVHVQSVIRGMTSVQRRLL